jgi:branched-chain amino acid transport system ATP-binding protein
LPPDALLLDGVDTYYGPSWAVQKASFVCRAGELVALIGRNGAGKTTCLHSVIGFTPPRAGRIEVFGRDVTRLAPERIVTAGAALVPQGRRIFKSLSVRENLAVAGRGGARSETDVYRLFPRLAERQKQLAGSLSGGEQQMLAIGRALMTNPRLLLLDEPSEGLAPQIVAELAHVLAHLKAEGLSIVLVEQNTRMALGLADRVVILNTGRVVFDGRDPAPEILDQNLGVH